MLQETGLPLVGDFSCSNLVLLAQCCSSTGHQERFNLRSLNGQSTSQSALQRLICDDDRQGGHGAVSLYLLYPELYKSSSAFAPILNPTQCPWGKKAFNGPNGDDGYLKGGLEEGKGRDATELLKKADKSRQLDIFIDYVR